MCIYIVDYGNLSTEKSRSNLQGRQWNKYKKNVTVVIQQDATIYSLFISVINQHDAQNFCFTISFISCLYMFRAHVLIIRRSKLPYTATGIITPIGGRLVHRSREDMCSKHVEAWNKHILKQKFCASSWLITEIDILRCTARKTSKFVDLHVCTVHQWRLKHFVIQQMHKYIIRTYN